MRSFRIFTKAGALWFIFCIAYLFPLLSNPVEAASMGPSLSDMILGAGAIGFLVQLLGLAVVVLTIVGAVQAPREGGWPHWRGLVLGLGEGAFLLSLLGMLLGMVTAYNEITRLGAAVTPMDLSKGISTALLAPIFGILVALVSLAGAGIIRLVERRA
jgi:hypothetical protein